MCGSRTPPEAPLHDEVETTKLAREIAHLAHGKAIYALGAVLPLLPEDRRASVFRFLADEYAELADPIERLLREAIPPKGRHQRRGRQ